jgi:putative PIN family toxin of toxin-antitoxin system
VPPRKERVPVVLDTNIIIGYYLSRNPHSANARVFQLWRDQRRLQIIVSDEVIDEYLEMLLQLNVAQKRIDRFAERLEHRATVTHINLGTRPTASRDPDDNIMLAAALGGKAEYLVTRDSDLLDIPDRQKRKFRFEILRPEQFLKLVDI